jgi:hypothetical protein
MALALMSCFRSAFRVLPAPWRSPARDVAAPSPPRPLLSGAHFRAASRLSRLGSDLHPAVPASAVRFALAVMTVAQWGTAPDGTRDVARGSGDCRGWTGPDLRCPGCLSVVEFCGNELKICGNTNCLCPVHCVKRWHSLAQRIARALDCNGFFLVDG